MVFLGLAPIAVVLCTILCSNGEHPHGSAASHASHRHHVSETVESSLVSHSVETDLTGPLACQMAGGTGLMATIRQRACDEDPRCPNAALGPCTEPYPSLFAGSLRSTQSEPDTTTFLAPLVLRL